MTDGFCRSCKHWHHLEHGHGLCRRYAPRIVEGQARTGHEDDSDWAVWPVTGEDDWCGEHEPAAHHEEERGHAQP